MLPSVSVALCTYNGAQFVAEQVVSILRQVPAPTELVVSDDGSTDDTVAIVRRVHAEHSNGTELRVVTGVLNLGVTANFERALTACSGDLIALSDQDDLWHDGRLAASIEEFLANPRLLLSHGDARLVDSSGTALGPTLFEALGVRARERAMLAEGRAVDVYIRRNLVTGAATMIRAGLIAVAAPFPAEWVHDEWLGMVAAITGEVHLDDRVLIDYRQHDGNQIGAEKPTLGYRVRRILEQRGTRYAEISARASILKSRLPGLNPSPHVSQLIERKASFERVRAGYPRARVARLAPVLAAAGRGDYADLSSQGQLDVVRDLIQPS